MDAAHGTRAGGDECRHTGNAGTNHEVVLDALRERLQAPQKLQEPLRWLDGEK